jgi:hypothetical protein
VARGREACRSPCRLLWVGIGRLLRTHGALAGRRRSVFWVWKGGEQVAEDRDGAFRRSGRWLYECGLLLTEASVTARSRMGCRAMKLGQPGPQGQRARVRWGLFSAMKPRRESRQVAPCVPTRPGCTFGRLFFQGEHPILGDNADRGAALSDMGFTFDNLVHPCRATSPRRMSDDETPSSNPARTQQKDPRVLKDLVRVGLKKTSLPEDADRSAGDSWPCRPSSCRASRLRDAELQIGGVKDAHGTQSGCPDVVHDRTTPMSVASDEVCFSSCSASGMLQGRPVGASLPGGWRPYR